MILELQIIKHDNQKARKLFSLKTQKNTRGKND